MITLSGLLILLKVYLLWNACESISPKSKGLTKFDLLAKIIYRLKQPTVKAPRSQANLTFLYKILCNLVDNNLHNLFDFISCMSPNLLVIIFYAVTR